MLSCLAQIAPPFPSSAGSESVWALLWAYAAIIGGAVLLISACLFVVPWLIMMMARGIGRVWRRARARTNTNKP